MAWTTLTLRKKDLKNTINIHELRDIELSRETRAVQRQLSYNQSIFNAEKTKELRDAKSDYSAVKKDRPGIKDDDYQEWQQKYADAKEDYEEQKTNIEEYYDSEMNEIEEEATDRENDIEQERTTLEAQLQAVRSELESVNDQIKSDIDSSKLTLS